MHLRLIRCSFLPADSPALLILMPGLTGKEIARSRDTSLLKVRTQIKSIKSKLGRRSLAQSVARCSLAGTRSARGRREGEGGEGRRRVGSWLNVAWLMQACQH